MIEPRSLFGCRYTSESIAKLFMIEQIPQLDEEIGAMARSARVGDTLHFVKFQEYTKNIVR